MNRILIVEDEKVIRDALQKLLEHHGYQVEAVESVEKAEQKFTLDDFNLLLVDIRLPGNPGTSLIDKVPNAPVLVMTSYASVRSAVDSMKKGAADYIAKPFDHDELLLLIKRLLKQNQSERTNRALKSLVAESYPVDGMIGSCEAMQAVRKKISKVAPTDATVLILGESGTGKELVARAIHEQSRRKEAPFITVNCAAIPETLVEPELFGHTRGAFTGADKARTGMIESADGGTLFLDEIGELPSGVQARLLRVLQDGEMRRVGSEINRRVDIRLLTATNRDLRSMVEDGLFRSDLYFRLRVVELTLPPLQERTEDIEELANHLLEKTCRQLNKHAMVFSPGVLEAIRQYNWPGNVRELENAIERATILADGNSITEDLLGIESRAVVKQPVSDLSLEDYFRQYVLANQDSMTETNLAKKLGISRKTLWEKRQRMGIPKSEKQP